MDEIQFHWDRLFGKIVKEGSQLEQWLNPSKSWTNHYIFKNKILRFLFSTILVWTTDFWHLLKFLFLCSIGLIICLIENPDLIWWQYGLELIVLGIGWFFFFELFNGILGAISDRLTPKIKLIRLTWYDYLIVKFQSYKFIVFAPFVILYIWGAVLKVIDKSPAIPTIMLCSLLILWFIIWLVATWLYRKNLK
jgi:hypothetical protein